MPKFLTLSGFFSLICKRGERVFSQHSVRTSGILFCTSFRSTSMQSARCGRICRRGFPAPPALLVLPARARTALRPNLFVVPLRYPRLRPRRGRDETYDVDGDDLTGRLLDLAELAEEVPEAGLGDDLVRGKDAHPVELGLGLLLRRQLAADDLVLLEATHAVVVGGASELCGTGSHEEKGGDRKASRGSLFDRSIDRDVYGERVGCKGRAKGEQASDERAVSRGDGGRGFRVGVRSHGARAEVEYRVKRSI